MDRSARLALGGFGGGGLQGLGGALARLHFRHADVELDDVDALYAENDLWPAVFDSKLLPEQRTR